MKNGEAPQGEMPPGGVFSPGIFREKAPPDGRAFLILIKTVLPSAPLPEGGEEEDGERNDFQTAHEHGQADHALAERREGGIGAGGAELAECRTDISHGGKGEAQRIIEGDPVKGEKERPEQDQSQIKGEEGEDAEKDRFGIRFVAQTDMDDLPGMENEPQGGGENFSQQEKADDLEAARCGAGAASDEKEEEQEEPAEGRPLVEVGRDVPRGGRNGGYREERVPERPENIGSALEDQGNRDEQGAAEDDGQEKAEFLILPYDGQPLFPGRYIQAEIGAGKEHEKHNDHLKERIVVVGDAFILCGKAAGGDDGKGILQGIQGRHAAEGKGNRSGCGEDQVGHKDGRGCFLDAGERLGRGGACGFRTDHLRLHPSRLWKEGHEEDNDAQAAHPVGEGAEEEKSLRQGGNVIDHGGARTGQAGNAFHQTVRQGQGFGKEVRQGIQEGNGNPRKGRNSHAFSRGQAAFRDFSFLLQHKGNDKGSRQGKKEACHRAAGEKIQPQRGEKQQPCTENDPGEQSKNDSKIHIIPSP